LAELLERSSLAPRGRPRTGGETSGQRLISTGALAPLLADPELWEAATAWAEHVAGPPRIAESAVSWSGSEPEEDISFLPTPGPGDSDDGNIY
jgi:hypothetical protein